MIFEKYIALFKDNLLKKGFSERTQVSYSFETKKFITFVEENYPRVKNINGIGRDILIDYNDYLICFKNKKDEPLAGQTIKLKLVVVKQFFKFLAKSDFILKDPSIVIEIPKEEKSLPKNVLTEKEVMLILDSIKTNTPIGIRNKAIIELFYSCGIRTSELCNLKIIDVDLKEQIVIVRKGKGNKTRVLPIGQYTCEYITMYLEKARKFMSKGKLTDDGYLFLTIRGTAFDKATINKCVIQQVIRNLKLDKKVSCYSMRHAVATHLIKNKVDIRYVQELLGHESIKTTQKYCHLEISDLKKMHSLYHPREKN